MLSSVPAVRGRIFINYRREDADFPAAWLFDYLVAHFGEEQIFKDIDAIQPGDDFADVIRAAVGSCEVLLVLIGDRWLTITDDDGRRRLDHPEDFVRQEIEAALDRNIRVIPILVGETPMPHAPQLPDGLANLARRQALQLSPARLQSDAKRLLDVLDRTLNDAATDLISGLCGWLESPRDGDEVGRHIDVRGHVTGWRHGDQLWVVHRRDPQGLFWPKDPKIRLDDHGNFLAQVIEGGPRGEVIISLLAVPCRGAENSKHGCTIAGRRVITTECPPRALTGNLPV